MINIFPGTHLYNVAVEKGIIADKVQYLKDGCPLTNVSCLTDSQYRELASNIYQTNMESKYPPIKYEIGNDYSEGIGSITITCNKCVATSIHKSDLLHVKRVWCPECNQRHYVDPFRRVYKSRAAFPLNDIADYVAL